jgi:transcriptional regulator with XRE-family HTH domain
MTYQNPIEDSQLEATGFIGTLAASGPTQSDAVVPGKHEQAAIVRTIGERMRQARELCNLSQSEAARRLGYAKSSKLSKIEAASDTNSVPLWAILAGARVYEVSVDFLFGITDDWEIGTPRGTQAWMLDRWQEARERDLRTLDKLNTRVTAVAEGVAAMVSASRRMGDAVSGFRARNGEFDDMPASAPVVHRLARLEAVAREAEVKLHKLHLAPKRVA